MLRVPLRSHVLPNPASFTRLLSSLADSLADQIASKGAEIRVLKSEGLDKAALLPHITELQALKAQLPATPATPITAPILTMEEIVSLCKRRGFVFPSSDIYNGFAGFYDYGPLGSELKNNIKQKWWQTFVHEREDVVGLDSSIIANPSIWEASGHTKNFADPMVDCKETKLRFRADQVSEEGSGGWTLAYSASM